MDLVLIFDLLSFVMLFIGIVILSRLFIRFKNSSFAFTLELIDLGILFFAISLATRVLTDVGINLIILTEIFQIASFLILGYGLIQMDKAFHTFKWLKEIEKE